MQEADRLRINELENLLTDERLRCNQHKQLYQALKEDYQSTVSELHIIRKQTKEKREINDSEKSSRESYIKKLEETLKEKQNTIYELEREASATNPDVLRKEIKNEEKKLYDERLSKVQAEADDFHDKYNNSHYDNCILKSSLEYAEKQHTTATLLLKSQHTAEVDELKAKINALEIKKEEPLKDYSVELRSAENELLQANSRLKVLHAECAELRKQNENLSIQMENDSQCHSKQLYEKIASIRALESEKEILQMQKEVLRNEISKLQQDKSTLNEECQSNKKGCLLATKQLEDCKRNYDINITNLTVKLQNEQSEHESAKEKLKDKIDALNNELNRLRFELESSERAFVMKEDNFNKCVMYMKQQNYQRFEELDRANRDLELRLKEAEFAKGDELMQLRKKLEEMTKESHTLIMDKAFLEKENLLLKNKSEEKAAQSENRLYEDLMKQNADFHKEIRLLQDKISMLSSSGAEHVIPRAVHHTDEAHLQRMVVPQVQEEVNQLRLTLEQQKYQYQQRIDGLENHMKEQQNSWLNDKQSLQQKVKQYGRLVTKLRDRFDSQKIHLEEVEVQNELLKGNVPFNDHLQLKNQLSDLQRKHERFHRVMLSSMSFLPDAELATLSAELDVEPVKKTLPLSLHQEPLMDPLFERIQDSTIRKPEQKRILSRRQRLMRSKRSESRRTADYSSSSDLENL